MLVINLYGGPGTGKSTTAAFTFAKLKQLGINTEYVSEFAKDLTWEERFHALKCQPYVLGKQLFRLERLRDKVDVVVTDSPILLCMVYGEHYGENFKGFVRQIHDGMDSVNIFLRRNSVERPYNPKGRNQTEAEAIEIDKKIEDVLVANAVPYLPFPMDKGDNAANLVVKHLQTQNLI